MLEGIKNFICDYSGKWRELLVKKKTILMILIIVVVICSFLLGSITIGDAIKYVIAALGGNMIGISLEDIGKVAKEKEIEKDFPKKSR